MRALDDFPELAAVLRNRPWHLLYVEDEAAHVDAARALLSSPESQLTIGQIDLVHAATAAQAVEALAARRFDLLMMDWHVGPDSGLELLAGARGEGLTTPAIMLTKEDDVARALDAGADDYVRKSRMLEELRPRVWARLRRDASRQVVRYGGLALNFIDNSATFQGVRIRLTQLELTVLGYLAAREVAASRRGANIEARVTIAELLDAVWEQNRRTWNDGIERVHHPGSNRVKKTFSILGTKLRAVGMQDLVTSSRATMSLEESRTLRLSDDEQEMARDLTRAWTFTPDRVLAAASGRRAATGRRTATS